MPVIMARLDMNREILTRERLEADQHYNEALTALDQALVDSGRRPELARADFERLTNRLIVFLQQITAFVESKDRELAAEMVERITKISGAIDTVAELRTQVNVLRRAMRTAAPRTQHPAPEHPHTSSTQHHSTQHQSTQHPAPSTRHPRICMSHSRMNFEDPTPQLPKESAPICRSFNE